MTRRCLSGPAQAGLALVAGALLLDCVALVLDIVRSVRIVRGAGIAESGLEISSTLSRAANAAVPGAMLVAGPIFLWWFYCSYRRLAERSATRFGSIWALIGWAVPGLNLIRPPAIMNELTKYRDAVLGWWLMWIVGAFVQVVLRFIDPSDQLGWAYWQSTALAADVVLLVSVSLAITLVRSAEAG